MHPRAAVLQALEAKSHLGPEEALAARPVLFDDMLVSPEEADALFRINDQARSTSEEWRQLFVEVMTDYVVRQQTPSGYVDGAKAQWLIDRISRDGRIKTATELELLLYVLDHAIEVPRPLARFALEQIASSALRVEAQEEGRGLTALQVAQLRRAVFAPSSDGGGAAVSREEAELLFRLNDAYRGRRNDPSWTDLFSRAVGASILAASGYRPPSREEALRREAWLEAPTRGVGGLLRDTVAAALRGDIRLKDDDPFAARIATVEHEQRMAERLDEAEVAWLASRIGRDGSLDENEAALLRFVKREAGQLHPAFESLMSQIEAIDGGGAPPGRAAG